MKELNDYIAQQKKIEPSPFLADKILNNLAHSKPQRTLRLWQAGAIAAGFAIVVALGVTLGNQYRQANYLSINDEHIENLTLFTSDENK
ncbi:MAG: hypothetical protein ACK5ND_02370 [Bacteroides sp.]